MARRRERVDATVQRDMVALLFLDIKGYSALKEHELRRFFEAVLPELARITRNSGSHYWNTWGDAIVCASKQPGKLCQAALELRDYFQHRNWEDIQVSPLSARVSLHAGVVYTGVDPFTDAQGLIGTQVNLAARVEPVVAPGQVWATDTFVSMLNTEANPLVLCDDLGERPLAKAWGSRRLFRVRRATEPTDATGAPAQLPATPANRVRGIHPQSSDLQQDLPGLIGSASASIDLCGVHFNTSLSDRRAAYLDALRRGVDLTVAVLNPGSPAVDELAGVFRMTAEELRSECTSSISILKGLRSDYEAMAPAQGREPGALRTLAFDGCPRCRCYLFDPASGSGTVAFTPYLAGFRSSHSPTYMFDAQAPAAQVCAESMRRVIASGVSI